MKHQSKIYLIASVFIIGPLTFAGLVIVPIFMDIKSYSDEIRTSRSQVFFATQQTSALEDFQSRYSFYEPTFKKADRLFVDVENPIDFVEFVEKTATDLNLDISMSLTPRAKESPASFQMSVKGEFFAIVRFSEQLENGPYLVTIQNVIMKKIEPVAPVAGPEGEVVLPIQGNTTGANFLVHLVSQ